MINLSLQHAALILAAQLIGKDQEFTGVSIDTRSLEPGNLYVAIRGTQFDGHDFVAKAQQAGAVAAIVERKIAIDLPQIIVADTTLALGGLAKYWRQQFAIPIVGITGSCGKTTTTQMTGAILSQIAPTLVPQGNHNNQWGVPLTLFHLNHQHHFAVIEMGADRPGEIKYLANIVQPRVAIITNIAPVHLEVKKGIGFGSLQGVFSEKSEIYQALSSDGTAIICADDDFYPQWKKNLSANKCLSFGYHNAQVSAKELQANHNMQYHFILATPLGETEVSLSSIGRHNVVNALAASAATLALGASLSTIKTGLANVPTVARRMIRLRAKKDAVLIDDSYNSNLKSVLAVLDMLADHTGPKIAILGDMLEIGSQSAAFHRQVGEYAKTLGIDHFYAYGKEAEMMAQGFGQDAKYFIDANALVTDVLTLLNAQTMIIVKGSFSMKMDLIVKALQQ